MSSPKLDLEKINELVEHPELFIVGKIEKGLSWSIYLPLRLAAKRTHYIASFSTPSMSDFRRSTAATIAGTVAGVATGLLTGFGFRYEKGTEGYLAFRNCPLIGGKISDFSLKSVVAIAFPYGKKSIDGKIQAETKGFIWRNKVLTGLELNLKDENVKRSIINDTILMNNLKEYFEIIVYWSGIENVDKIRFETKDKKYNIILFTLPRFNKKYLDFLFEHGKDPRRLPELLFDISMGISEKVLTV
ncbi:MAG: hypothetical protein QXM53_05515 [Thermofilaceae archaeon]